MKLLNIKRLALLFSVLLPSICYSQTIQKGRVLEKDSNGKPLENAEILAKNALPANSDNEGKYQLIFKEKSPGEMIFVDSINKKGYELVNESQVQNWKLSNVKEFDIILCKEGLLKESREFFYGIGKSHYENEYKQKRSEIDELKQANQIAEKEYNQRLKEIYDERQKAYERLDYYSDLFSRINTDDLSEIEKRAFELSKQGKIDEAIQVYESEKLLIKFIKNDSLKQQTKIDLESMIPSVKRYAELCSFAGGKDNYNKAVRCYEAIALSDTTNFEYVSECSRFLRDQNQFDRAEKFYILLSQLVKKAGEINTTAYLPNMANALNDLAIFHTDLNRFDLAEKEYNEALKISRKLALSQSDENYLSNVATTLHDLANLHCNFKRYNIAEKEYTESLAISRILVQFNPEAFLPNMATTLNNLGSLYSESKRYRKAEKKLSEALVIKRELFQSDSDAYLPDVAICLDNLATLHCNIKYYEMAEKEYSEALEIRRKIVQSNPDAYLPDFAVTLNNIGNLHNLLKNYYVAEKEYFESLQIRHKLAKQNPERFNQDVAQTLGNISELYFSMKQYNKAANNCSESLKIYKDISICTSQNYKSELASQYGNLACYSLFLKQFGNAEISAKEGLRIDPSQTWIYSDLANALLFQGKKEEAKQIYIKYKNKIHPQDQTKTFKFFFLKDLDELEKANITHPEVERIRQLLK